MYIKIVSKLILVVITSVMMIMGLRATAQTIDEYNISLKEQADNLIMISIERAIQDDYAEAIRLGTQALELQEKTLGKEHPDYAASLLCLAYYNSRLGNYAEAIRLETQALEILEKTLGKEYPGYATSLNNLASYNSRLGNYAEAIRLETQALEIREKTLGKEHPDYAISLNNLANYNYYLGNYAESIRLGTQALEICEKTLGKEHPGYATSLNNLASYNSSIGNYAEAIRLGTQALEIREKTLGKEHPGYATSLNNLADYNSSLGNYAEAVRLGTQALEIQKKTLGKEHPDYAISLSNLAGYNSSLGNYAEAIRLGTQALEIREKTLGKEHPDYATSLNNLAGYNSDLGNYAEAIRLGTQALEIREKTLGKEHPDYALSLGNLANYNSRLGNYAEAIRLGTQALEIQEKTLGKEHPDYARLLFNLLSIKAENNPHDIKVVEGEITECTDVVSNIVLSAFKGLPARERSSYWTLYSSWYYNDLPGYGYYINDGKMHEAVLNGTLLSKGLLLNAETELSTIVKEKGDAEVAKLFDEITMLNYQIEALIKKPVSERYCDVDSLEQVRSRMEWALMSKSEAYGDYTANLQIDWRQVQARLGKRDVAVEFLSFPVRNDSVMYTCFVVKPGMETPEHVALFEKKELDAHRVRATDDSQYKLGNELGNLVWGKLRPYIADAENVYFAPAGELYNIPIEAIAHCNANLYRLSSTRELAVRRNKDKIERSSVYGGIKYDVAEGVLAKDSEKYPRSRSVDFGLSASTDSLRIRADVKDLPATLTEAKNVHALLKGRRLESDIKTDTVATEASFKALDGKRCNMLHIATHGFYWNETEARMRATDKMQFLLTGDENRNRNVEDKALTRSGLLFAGAKNSLEGATYPDGVDDGILTAKEISQLDLRGLDLVVLSACQTGLGDVTGDGVFGLQRGFKKAGANTLLMSLWKVDDNATQLLMTRFYENVFAKNMPKHQALQDAQRYVREYEEERDEDVFVDMTEEEKQKLLDQQEIDQAQAATNTRIERRKVTRTPYASPKYWAAWILLDAIN